MSDLGTSVSHPGCTPIMSTLLTSHKTSALSEKHLMLLMATTQGSPSSCPGGYSVRVRPPGREQSRNDQDTGPAGMSPLSCLPLLPYKYPHELSTSKGTVHSYTLLFLLVLSIYWLDRRSDHRGESPPFASDKRIHHISPERGSIQVSSANHQKSPLQLAPSVRTKLLLKWDSRAPEVGEFLQPGLGRPREHSRVTSWRNKGLRGPSPPTKTPSPTWPKSEGEIWKTIVQKSLY